MGPLSCERPKNTTFELICNQQTEGGAEWDL